ncbi:MAG: HAD family hydrolase [Thermoanaerobaculia bacterium]
MKLKAVLLDMGGVVLEMANARGVPVDRLDWRGREALLRLIRQQGGHLKREDLEHLLFAPWRARHDRRHELGREARWDPHLSRLRRHAGIRTHNDTLLAAWFRPYGEQLAPVPGAEKALIALQDLGLALVLVSNVPLPGEHYRRVLDRYGLGDRFAALFFSYDFGSRKPSPAMLRAALERLGVSASEALMVGDLRDRDIAAGRAAGTSTVWVRSHDGGGPEPDHEIDSLAELPELLRS